MHRVYFIISHISINYICVIVCIRELVKQKLQITKKKKKNICLINKKKGSITKLFYHHANY